MSEQYGIGCQKCTNPWRKNIVYLPTKLSVSHRLMQNPRIPSNWDRLELRTIRLLGYRPCVSRPRFACDTNALQMMIDLSVFPGYLRGVWCFIEPSNEIMICIVLPFGKLAFVCLECRNKMCVCINYRDWCYINRAQFHQIRRRCKQLRSGDLLLFPSFKDECTGRWYLSSGIGAAPFFFPILWKVANERWWASLGAIWPGKTLWTILVAKLFRVQLPKGKLWVIPVTPSSRSHARIVAWPPFLSKPQPIEVDGHHRHSFTLPAIPWSSLGLGHPLITDLPVKCRKEVYGN